MILLDYKDRRPIYEQIAEKLTDLMVRGVLKENTPLPSVRSLATDLSINPNTVQRAYIELERKGYIYSQKGKGSFVARMDQIREGKRAVLLQELENLLEQAAAAGIGCSELTEAVTAYFDARDRRNSILKEDSQDDRI